MNFSRFLDIQSWWEVPSIAYFCSLFRTAFNLLDFDIEELEEALLTDGTEDSGSSLLTELIVRLLNGCLGNNDISAFNYQMYLRRLFRQKCQESGRYNPFNTDIDFQFLPLRRKVEILYALCDFRLDAEDVFDLFKNLEAESLRVEPLGWDDNDSAYWYFYGTRLYREDIVKKPKGKKKKKNKDKKRGWLHGEDWNDDETERVWQVVCFTEEDWTHLTQKFSKATSKVEKELFRSLSQNFMPEIPRLFQEKERLQRKRLLELAPRRTSSRVLQKIRQKEEEESSKATTDVETSKDSDSKESQDLARRNRAKRRNLLRSKSVSSSSSSDSSDSSEPEAMPQKTTKSKNKGKKSKNSSATHKGEPPPGPPIRTGRKTNNSLASATGQIVIPDTDEPVSSTRKKLKTSQIFSQTDEDIQIDMYKVLEQLTNHEDAWPFLDPVEEEYAPNYYTVIRRPMDLHKMEERLDSGFYTDFSSFKADFKLIVNNCRLYNGHDNEYTAMVDNLQAAFDRLTEKYIYRVSSSDEEIAVEYQLPTPTRRQKRKASDSPARQAPGKRKKQKSHSEDAEPKSSTSDIKKEKCEDDEPENLEKDDINDAQDEADKGKDEEDKEADDKMSKESHKDKGKKKRKGHHHRHGKHSKNHKKNKQHGSKSKHSKKQKHGKNKDKEGKKSRQKKKKSKHQDPEPEPPEVLKRSDSQESVSSSNRSRSASPLPSIHTPSPSPTELDKPEASKAEFDKMDYDQPATSKHHAECEFLKDKYDKIKERRRHAAKDVWESLFDYKQKSDKQKQNLNIPEKEKNQKLRETIEKLKAKNEKYKDTSLFASLFTPRSTRRVEKKRDYKEENSDDECSDDEPLESVKGKCTNKKLVKKSSAKNESASEALEEAVKDISKWLDEAPKASTVSSPCDSPAPTVSTEEQDSCSRQDDELSQGERSLASRKDASKKRHSSREPKLVKRREIQRTIDRLQPGKSKGNLLTNLANKTADKSDDTDQSGQANKNRESKDEEPSPKLSLGSVLPTVDFTLITDDHNFCKDENEREQKTASKATETEGDIKVPEIIIEKEPEKTPAVCNKKDAEVETEPPFVMKPSQEKATPNLSAWFKAFGAPKTTAPVATTKKKTEETENEEKPVENNEIKSSPRVGTVKFDSPNDPNSPNPDGGDSPHPSMSATPRQRRTSTGSSVSERSSFSQDLDSPRHQMSHTSPLLRSPASPRNDDFQKITYPIINGTVRAGFYQDTTSLKSSPDKSCSPREAPQSPYSPYPQHVYASSSTAPGSATPNYFIDHNKSPLPTYTQNAPPYYDSAKATAINKPTRTNDDYTSVAPEMYPSHFNSPYSPSSAQYSPVQTNYSQPQISPQPTANSLTNQNATQMQDPKPSLFPVKKRTYNEPEQIQHDKVIQHKEPEPQKNDYAKISQVNNIVMSAPSVDDIALALSERSQMAKLNNSRDMRPPEYTERQQYDIRKPVYENNEPAHANKRDMNNVDLTKPLGMTKKDAVDMVNMGYFNSEDRRNSTDTREVEYLSRDTKSSTQAHKGYEIEAIAINLGINSQQLPKPLSKPNITTCNMTPAHSHERQHVDMSINQNIAHAHQNQYDLPSGQVISNFSLNDIELANKKLYANNIASSTALDYGNWKNTNQMRKQDILPSDYSSAYTVNNEEKNKVDSSAALNYKNMQHQQYNNYANMPRLSNQRTPELSQNIPSELRIPNPRAMHKPDNAIVTPSADDTIAKNIDAMAKAQKAEKLAQNHPLVSSIPYKTPYSTHSTLPIDSLRNLPNIPQMLERYSNDERYLSSFATTTSSLYHDKTFQMAHMFNKSLVSDVNTTVSHSNIYSQPAVSMSKDNNIIYKNTTTPANAQIDTKTKPKRKRTTDSKQTLPTAQTYQHPTSCGNDVLTSVKTSIMPTTAFNFGASTNMALSGMYGENTGFSIDDFRNSTSQLMAANYMAAVAHQQRNNEANAEKLVKPAHQNTNHSASSFPFIAHSQVRAGYPFVGTETSSPLYQQYIQRYQEELQRQTGAQIMGLYPPTYPPPLGVRQPYDSINRSSWI
ncbi:uncharacterized protein LOC119835850 [Zerene cesonia]|uniref:uncharacterized protein LOC119835850 n=1 Tax=Zerene cesonia TaxID=33412 RepID=UPI0018E568F3|nr:uncharacterized protein LOC119835850 [Zerene cesonia]